MTIDALRSQFHTHAEGMDAHDPNLYDTSDQVSIHLPPLRRREIMDVSTFYHGAHSFSLFSVRRLKRSILPCGISHSKPGPPS